MAINFKINIFEEVLKNITEGVVITNKEGKILWINDAFTTLSGYNKNYLLGNISNVLISDMYEKVFDALFKRFEKYGLKLIQKRTS